MAFAAAPLRLLGLNSLRWFEGGSGLEVIVVITVLIVLSVAMFGHRAQSDAGTCGSQSTGVLSWSGWAIVLFA